MSISSPAGAFSSEARRRLVDAYLGDRVIVPATAWTDVYRLLLWTDPTTGLAHCYESDKAQPGRPWYGRTLAFHCWLAETLGVSSLDLAEELDWMFRQVIDQIAGVQDVALAKLATNAAVQRARYADPMPAPGDDAELLEIIEPVLAVGPSRPDDQSLRRVLQRVRTHIGLQNKRKNLLGRGFEDVLAALIGRIPKAPPLVQTQVPIQAVPGFRQPRAGDKEERVDLWVNTSKGRRVLVSAKWSARADREKQMLGDFQTYVSCNMLREPFEYYWLTNEFDAARLVANATATHGNQWMFDAVVHISPDALSVVHELEGGGLRGTPARLKTLIAEGRIIGLSKWLADLTE